MTFHQPSEVTFLACSDGASEPMLHVKGGKLQESRQERQLLTAFERSMIMGGYGAATTRSASIWRERRAMAILTLEESKTVKIIVAFE